MFQVPTNTEITSGSLCWECLIFISWTRWQKASRFWKTERSREKQEGVRKIPVWWLSSLTRALSNIISRGVAWWLSMTTRILLWSLTIWRTKDQQTSAGSIFAWRCDRVIVLPYSSHARSSPPQTTQPSCQRAARLRPRPQTPSVCRTSASSPGQAGKKSSSHGPGSKVVSPLPFTWKELTGEGLAGVFAGGAIGGVGSGGGLFRCTARLWLATASCKAFSTCEERKQWGVFSIIRANTLTRIHWLTVNPHCCRCQQILLYLTTQHTLFSSDERRLTKAEILHSKLSISISGPCVQKYLSCTL